MRRLSNSVHRDVDVFAAEIIAYQGHRHATGTIGSSQEAPIDRSPKPHTSFSDFEEMRKA